METMLLFITGISVAVALAAAFAAWRVRDREMARRQARVAALSSAIRPAIEPFSFAVDEGRRAIGEASARIDATADAQVTPAQSGATAFGGMFSAASQRPGTNPRVRATLAIAAGAGALLIGAVLVGSGTGHQASNVAKAPTPLELLALRHEQGVDALTVSGMVRNPSVATPVRNLTAVVFLFDKAGGFLGSSRAPVDFTTLAPGEDSPFTVTLKPAPTAAARYRVSFRQDDRGMLPHVDRREKS